MSEQKMKIGLIQMNPVDVKSYARFYNVQELGLAKAFIKLGYECTCYKFVRDKRKDPFYEERQGVPVCFIPASFIGTNGIASLKALDRNLDMLIFFSDLQLLVPSVSRWCQKHHVLFIPYVGVTVSNSKNKMIQMVKNLLYKRNERCYKRAEAVAVKTPEIIAGREEKRVVIPVGLDIQQNEKLELEKDKFLIQNRKNIREKLQIPDDATVLLFVGRLCSEKNPVHMIEILQTLKEQEMDNRGQYYLIMIGTGDLSTQVKSVIEANDLEDRVRMIERVKNEEMYLYYQTSDWFINLTRHEIFGMCILEALYYRVKVAAFHAPGPDFILRERTGILADDTEEIVSVIRNGNICEGQAACEIDTRKYIEENFCWENAAKTFIEIGNRNLQK